MPAKALHAKYAKQLRTKYTRRESVLTVALHHGVAEKCFILTWPRCDMDETEGLVRGIWFAPDALLGHERATYLFEERYAAVST